MGVLIEIVSLKGYQWKDVFNGKWPFIKSYNGWSLEKIVNIYAWETPSLIHAYIILFLSRRIICSSCLSFSVADFFIKSYGFHESR